MAIDNTSALAQLDNIKNQALAIQSKINTIAPTNPIPSDALNRNNDITMPSVKTPTSNDLATRTAEMMKLLAPTANPQMDSAMGEVANLNNQLANRGTAYNQKLNEFAGGDFAGQVQALQNKNLEATRLSSQIDQEIQGQYGQGRAMSISDAFADKTRREGLMLLNAKNAEIAAMQGNLTLAQKFAEGAIAAEFDPIQQRIENLRQFITLNENQMSREEKRRADALNVILNQEEQALNEQKSARQANISLMAKYGDAGITYMDTPEQVQAKLAKSPTYQAELAYQRSVTAKNYQDGTVSGTTFSGGSSNPEIQSIEQQVFNLTAGWTETKRSDYVAGINRLIASGQIEQARESVRIQALNGLAVDERNSYRANEKAVDSYKQVVPMLDSGALQTGPYKDLLESAKPWLLIQKDQRYADFKSLAGAGETAIRLGNFGVALTPQELAKSKEFLISENDDIATIRTKVLNSMAMFQFANDIMVYNRLGGIRPELQNYLTDVENQYPQQQSATMVLNNILGGDTNTGSTIQMSGGGFWNSVKNFFSF